MNVQASDKDDVIDILKNAWSQRCMDKDTLKLLLIKVQMNTKSMTIILSFKDVASILGVGITMYLSNKRSSIVHWNIKIINFTECDDGFHFSDTTAPENNRITEDSKNIAAKQAFSNCHIIITISNNKEFYTQK